MELRGKSALCGETEGFDQNREDVRLNHDCGCVGAVFWLWERIRGEKGTAIACYEKLAAVVGETSGEGGEERSEDNQMVSWVMVSPRGNWRGWEGERHRDEEEEEAVCGCVCVW